MNSPGASSYRLLACDVDGTLVGDDVTISPRVRQALAATQAREIQVTLATGRGFPATLPFAQLLNITIPLICYQGGLIKHPLTGEIIFQSTMNRSLVLQVVDLARARDWHLVVYIEDIVFFEVYRRTRNFYDDLLGLELQRVEDIKAVVSDSESDPTKFLIVAEETECNRIQAEMDERFGQQMNIVRSHRFFVEGNPLDVNKGDALRRLAEYLGVPQRQTVAIGDQGNDVPMIAWAGLGLAMGNGSKIAQSAADWIAPSVSEDGAAVAIERFLLR